MSLRKLIASGLLMILLVGCTEESFRQGGRDMLGGACAHSTNCTVHCPDGQGANDYGRCSPANAH